MSERTFAAWLQREAAAARCLLLTRYEQRDWLEYMEGPRLEREYMDKIGSFEETVIKEEIECELLRKKQQMIQAAINRREPVDEAAIDALLEVTRQEMLREAAGTGEPREYAQLSEEERDELQELYRQIVRDFHPQVHPELTEVHRELFRKAQEAYRRRDLPALRLVWEMLKRVQEGDISADALLGMLAGVSLVEGEAAAAEAAVCDYTLAELVYGSFCPTAEETAIREEAERCRQMARAVTAEMEAVCTRFPHTAREMLEDPVKIEAYKKDLEHRLHAAAQERERREMEIREMLKEAARYE